MKNPNVCKLSDLDINFVYDNLSDFAKSRHNKQNLISSIQYFSDKGLKFNTKRGVTSTTNGKHLSSYSQLPHESNTLEDIVWNEFSPLISNHCSMLSNNKL